MLPRRYRRTITLGTSRHVPGATRIKCCDSHTSAHQANCQQRPHQCSKQKSSTRVFHWKCDCRRSRGRNEADEKYQQNYNHSHNIMWQAFKVSKRIVGFFFFGAEQPNFSQTHLSHSIHLCQWNFCAIDNCVRCCTTLWYSWSGSRGRHSRHFYGHIQLSHPPATNNKLCGSSPMACHISIIEIVVFD